MKFRIDLHERQFFYNMMYSGNLYGFSTPLVVHYVENGDPFDTEYSEKRWYYRSLRNIFWRFRLRNYMLDWEKYLGKEVKLIFLNSDFFTDGIVPKTMKLFFSIPDKTFVAEDLYGDGLLIWKDDSDYNHIVGFVFYEHGFVVLFGQQELNSVHKENYRNMIQKLGVYDESLRFPKWVYFFNTGNPSVSPCPDTRFAIECDIRSDLYKETLFLTAGGLNWSNSPLFYPRGGDVQVTPNSVTEVVSGGEEKGGKLCIPSKNVSIYGGSWFNKQLEKQGAFSLSLPVFLKYGRTTTVKVSFDI